ncbi:hypothetical protein EXIGLDRAFT_773977 [Exidia glandulosa HHB12029]|uniref:Uncharacterized protein n=1 Tax=Exidia glandulosa HHB12029 TaxID=1314781 RepID=A0A165EK40_EXIGL|nr:hypothetical protein EXIGLDRAFT_773977 [Exidia glandulosa HHB12029]
MPSIPFDGSKPFRLVPPATPARFSARDTTRIVARNTVPDDLSSTRTTSKSSQPFRLVPPPGPEHPATQKTTHQKPIDEEEPVTRSSSAGSSRHHPVSATSTSQLFRLVPPPAPIEEAALRSEPVTRSSAAGSSRHHTATSQLFRLVPPPAPVQDKIQKSADRFTVVRPPTPVPFSLELPPAQETIQQRADDVGVPNYQKPIDVKALRASAKKALKAQRHRVEQKHESRANERYYFQHAKVDWETPLSRQELEEILVISLTRAVKKEGRALRKPTRLEIAQMVDIKLRSREQASAPEFRRPLPKVPASSKSTVLKVKSSPMLDALGFPEDILEMLALALPKATRLERFATPEWFRYTENVLYEFRNRDNGIEGPETKEQVMGLLLPALLPGDASLVLEMSRARDEFFQLARQHEDEYGDDSMEWMDVQIDKSS